MCLIATYKNIYVVENTGKSFWGNRVIEINASVSPEYRMNRGHQDIITESACYARMDMQICNVVGRTPTVCFKMLIEFDVTVYIEMEVTEIQND